jgi:uncharacterized phage protein (TIGR02218 family)
VKPSNTLINNILSSGQYTVCECYDITLATGQTYHFTSWDYPLSGISVLTKSGTAGPFNYLTGLTIVRDKLTQKLGTEAGNMELLIAPQTDAPGGAPTIAGYPIVQAARYGFLDGAKIQLNKLFLNPAIGANAIAIGWFLGTAQDVQTDRFMVHITLDDFLAYLANQQMPRLIFQVGCFHEVYDQGCGLLKASFTTSGALTSVGDAAHFVTNLTQVSNYFRYGVLTFTSGVNNGVQGPVNTYTLSGTGAFVMRFPFPAKPSIGDTFTVYPGCDKQQATCSNASTAVGAPFNNLVHFAGQPYVPVPETILDGGTDNPPAQTSGGTAGTIIGSQPSARTNYGGYKT